MVSKYQTKTMNQKFRHFIYALLAIYFVSLGTFRASYLPNQPVPIFPPVYRPHLAMLQPESPPALGLPTNSASSDRSPTSNQSTSSPIPSIPIPPNPAAPPDHPNYRYTALLNNNSPLYPQEPFLNRLSIPAALASISPNNQNASIIAVIDTGFGLNHTDLNAHWALNSSEMGATTNGSSQSCSNLGLSLDKRCNNYDNNGDGYPSNWRGWDFVNNDNDPSAGTTSPTASAVTHGTLTASLAAVLNPNAKIMPLQALDDTGVGYTDTVGAAIRYAADHGATVISLSLGSPYDDAYLRSEIDYAISKGVLVIAAAGNNGCDCLSYPAAYPEVLSVGATDSSDSRASFSSYGANLDVVAPGTAGDVCAALWTQSNPTSAYSCGYSGTSFATPLTASLASLIQTQNPSASPNDIIRFITQSSDKLTGMAGQNRNLEYGYGRINAYKSLLAASLSNPQGQLLNKASASLSATDLTSGPLLDSTCQGIPGAYCDIRISSADGAIIKYLGAQTLDNYGGANFIWNAVTLGLTPGQWKIESIMMATNQTTTKSPVWLTIYP